MKYNIDFSGWKLNFLSTDNIHNYSDIFLTISTNKFSIINKKKYYIKLPSTESLKYPIYNECFVDNFIKIYKIPNVLMINSICLFNVATKLFSLIQLNQLTSDYTSPHTNEYIGLIYDCKYYMRTLNTLPKLNKYDQYTILFQIYIVLNLLKDIFSHNNLTIDNVIYYEVPNGKRIKITYIYNGQNIILYVKYIPYMKNLDQSRYFIDFNNTNHGFNLSHPLIQPPPIYHTQIDIRYFVDNSHLFDNIGASSTDTINITSFYIFLQKNYSSYTHQYSDNDIVSEKTYNFDNYNLPKYIMPVKKTLKIMTFNVHMFYSTDFYTIKKTFEDNQPHIICTQENFKEKQPQPPNDPFTQYNQVICAGINKEALCVYQLKNTPSITNTKIIKTTPPSGIKYKDFNRTKQIYEDFDYKFERNGIIFEYDGIKIANIHLDGGTFADKTIYYDADNGWTYYIKLLDYKKKLLEDIIETKPDIIVGDFNTFYAVNKAINDNYHAKNLNYIQSLYTKTQSRITMDLTKSFNDAIIELISKEYQYMQPEDETQYTSLLSETIVDMIWYKKNGKVQPTGSSKILNVSHKLGGKKYIISDHNPVIGTFVY